MIGRRNWLFADTPKGATASARLYSLVKTAKVNGLEPWAYLTTIFEKLPAATYAAEIEALLPGRIEMGDLRTATPASPTHQPAERLSERPTRGAWGGTHTDGKLERSCLSE